MRYITALGVAALALGISGTGMTCAAQQIPSGSYQQTCRDIGVRGSTLYASCQDTGGGWRSAQLSDFQRCNGEIQNLNGSLQCPQGGNGYGQNTNSGYGNEGNGREGNYGRDDNGNRDRDRDADQNRRRDDDNGYNNPNGNSRYGYNDIPNGSYAQTCQNITVNGNTLQASCQKKNGKWRNTSLQNYNRCNGQIANENGKLYCR